MIGEKIVQRLEEATEGRIRRVISDPFERLNRAHNAGWVDDCIRHLCLQRICPENEKTHDIDKQRIYDEGHRQEELMRQEVQDCGFEIKKVTPIVSEEYELRMEADDLIRVNGDYHPVDYKSCSDYMFRQIEKVEDWHDLRESKHIWIRHYPAQIQLYDYHYSQAYGCSDTGILFFKGKDKGKKHAIDVPYDLGYVEHILTRLQAVNEWIKKGEAPVAEYAEACKGCGFFDFCFPGNDFLKEKVERISDEEADLKFQRYFEIEKFYREGEKLKKELTAQFRGQNVIVGDAQVVSSEYDVSTYNVPQDIKDQYKDKVTRIRTSLKNLAAPI